MRGVLGAAALLVTACVALTAGHALHRADARVAPDDRAAPGAVPGDTGWAAEGEPQRCAIYHARFGGTRAELVRLVVGDVANYVVLEVSRGTRLPPTVPSAWLRAAFGAAEPSWLGEFASPDSALQRAVRLCPASTRCAVGEQNCGPATLHDELRPGAATPDPADSAG
jgi:hypothetical protein